MEISVSIPTPEDGLTGRECPECEKYFRIEFGTGLKGDNLPCHCPYCGHQGSHDTFYTQEQIAYARKVAEGQVIDHVFNQLSTSMKSSKHLKITSNRPRRSIPTYREGDAETTLVCDNCTLRYSVYGVFAYCPDCKVHNSTQILNSNLDLVESELKAAEGDEHRTGNALEDCISAFDAFGKELCKKKGEEQGDAVSIGFQNLSRAATNVLNKFSYDLKGAIPEQEWLFAIKMFQKRHLIAHQAGVVDNQYLEKSGDTEAVEGRKVPLRIAEIESLIGTLRNLATALTIGFGMGHQARPRVAQVSAPPSNPELSKEEKEILICIEDDGMHILLEMNTAQTGSFLGNNTRKFIDENDPEFSRKTYLEAGEELHRKGYLSLEYNKHNRKKYELTAKGVRKARGLKEDSDSNA